MRTRVCVCVCVWGGGGVTLGRRGGGGGDPPHCPCSCCPPRVMAPTSSQTSLMEPEPLPSVKAAGQAGSGGREGGRSEARNWNPCLGKRREGGHVASGAGSNATQPWVGGQREQRQPGMQQQQAWARTCIVAFKQGGAVAAALAGRRQGEAPRADQAVRRVGSLPHQRPEGAADRGEQVGGGGRAAGASVCCSV